jgi:hypothetical protein
VRVTAPNSTDFSFKIPQNARIHRNTGEATKEKVRDARSVRAREAELPAHTARSGAAGSGEEPCPGRDDPSAAAAR